jgi:membrane-associated phospholipid phosphatase
VGICLLVLILLWAPACAQTSPKAFLKDFAADQKAIWTSPKQAPKNAEWLAPLALATGALIATDHRTSTALPNTHDQLAVSSHISDAGIGYIAGIPSALLLAGALRHNEKARDTGFLAVEALADSAVVMTGLKYTFLRERPLDGDRDGDFWEPRPSPSFPSGHSILAWSVASVVAHRYSSSRAVVIASYGAASLISLSRFSGRQHFISDVLVGSAMGWLIGRYVARKHSIR